jgi:hypothetical protein
MRQRDAVKVAGLRSLHGEELLLTERGRSYNVSAATMSRLSA